jgi:uncharacterized protein YjbI with pentapeptide repeats
MRRKRNYNAAIYEEFSLKEIIIFLCENARKQSKRCNLRHADLSDANMSGADLRRADLRRADLRRADLSDADLSDADLRHADLRHADMSGADLSDADFDYSVLNLSCKGINLNFDDRTIKQLMNHALKQNNKNKIYNEIRQAVLNNPEWHEWLENWHRKNEVKDLKEFIN